MDRRDRKDRTPGHRPVIVIPLVLCMLLLVFPEEWVWPTAQVKALARIGGVDMGAVQSIKGRWQIEGSGDGPNFIHEYTTDFACKIGGISYFRYSRPGVESRAPYIFTIVRSKETDLQYFARGYYRNGRLYGTTSRIEIMSTDFFMVYSDKNPRQIYFKAQRIHEPSQKSTKNAEN